MPKFREKNNAKILRNNTEFYRMLNFCENSTKKTKFLENKTHIHLQISLRSFSRKSLQKTHENDFFAERFFGWKPYF